MDRVAFTQEDGTEIGYYVLAEAKVGQDSYLLCTEEEEGDAEAFVMKAVPGEDDDDPDMMTYESVEDDQELRKAVEALKPVLKELDIDIDSP